MGKKISFWWDAEKRIRVARAGEVNSLFFEAYRQALAGVAEIVRAGILHEKEYTYDPFFLQSEKNRSSGEDELHAVCDREYLYDYPNNIIVFSGERGAGKSSAMLTFVNGLKEERGLLFQDDFLTAMVSCELPNVNGPAVKQMMQACRFVDMAPIDPTTLEADGQILTVILARMFRLASNSWEKKDNSFGGNHSAQRLKERDRLIQMFSTCYEHIQAIKRGGVSMPEYEGLDTLAELGDSSQLKVELYHLVKQLLKFCCPEQGDSSYLVLQIDDTDMNIKQAYAILEDVRRYLVIPRLVIVMAADLKHLMQVVESNLLKDYDENLNSRNEYVEKITHQYITKLFPQTRQIDLPDLGAYFREHTETITIQYRIPGKFILPDEKKDAFPNAQDQILRLIYRKTGMAMLTQEHSLHPIIPSNMRLLAHFLSMLIQMDDVEDPDAETPGFFLKVPATETDWKAHVKKLNTRLQNVQRFRNYFLTTWITNSLNNQSVQLFRDLEQIDIADRIRYICTQLDARREKAGNITSDPAHERTPFETKSFCGDMLEICQDIMEQSWDEELRRLAFAFPMYCSLIAHTLALEDLIDYYDDPTFCEAGKAKENDNVDQEENPSQHGRNRTGLGCSFSKLHLLFGARLFPYLQENSDGPVWVNLRPRGEDNAANAQKVLRVAWSVKSPLSALDLSSCNINMRPRATLLYAMLADHRKPDYGKPHGFDLMKPIANCLYLGDHKGHTPFSDSIPDAVPLNRKSIEIKDEDWESMGNSALTAALNCDVQMKISSALLHEIRISAANTNAGEASPEYEGWLHRIREFYRIIEESFGKDLPIRFLENMKFSGWMEPLSSMEVDKPEAEKDAEDKENKQQWKEIVKKLSANVANNAPSQTAPAGGEGSAAAGAETDPAAGDETDPAAGDETDPAAGTVPPGRDTVQPEQTQTVAASPGSQPPEEPMQDKTRTPGNSLEEGKSEQQSSPAGLNPPGET